ncbi:hypothetical protein ACLM5J_08915 [Nocardioides sp. Bht2]|uniref:hypothetical protein n=1 Tax=Nocardioides sp. Bht2 TaxID=3392297 RepID=UPI0039B3B3F3
MAAPVPLPRHLILVPGCQVLRRDHDTLQVGVGDRQLPAPDLPAVRALLARLRDGAANGPLNELPHVAASLLCALLDRGLVVDSEPVLRQLGATETPWQREQLAAALLEHPDAVTRAAHRATLRVRLVAPGLPTWARHTRTLLAASGLAVADDGSSAADVALLISAGPVPRPQLDAWMQEDLPHLLVGADGARVRLGPFVVPGASTCLRCIDAHRADVDPAFPLLIEQRSTAATPTALPAPIAHDLVGIGVAMAVRELTTWSADEVPITLDHTVEVDPGLTFPTTPWQRHPGCGCGWHQAVGTG